MVRGATYSWVASHVLGLYLRAAPPAPPAPTLVKDDLMDINEEQPMPPPPTGPKEWESHGRKRSVGGAKRTKTKSPSRGKGNGREQTVPEEKGEAQESAREQVGRIWRSGNRVAVSGEEEYEKGYTEYMGMTGEERAMYRELEVGYDQGKRCTRHREYEPGARKEGEP